MENYLTVSDNGQIEIAWELLNLPGEIEVIAKSVISNMVNVLKTELVAVEKVTEELDLFFQGEKFFKGELIHGIYSTVSINTVTGESRFNSIGLSDIKKFGFVKEGAK